MTNLTIAERLHVKISKYQLISNCCQYALNYHHRFTDTLYPLGYFVISLYCFSLAHPMKLFLLSKTWLDNLRNVR